MNKNKTLLFVVLVAVLLTSCLTLPDAHERKEAAQQLAAARDWQYMQWSAGDFTLAGFGPARLVPGPSNASKASILRIYIEGDGLAWITSRRPSKNPTPVSPLALELALADEQPSVYLARPCQYVSADTSCLMKYWTSARYAEELVVAMDEAVSKIKKRYKVKHLELVGYSGGGTIAALITARRNDVKKLVTVAGNMDHEFWTSLHKVSPLTGSLNPVDFAQQLADVPQLHFVGADDYNLPVTVINSYKNHFSGPADIDVRVIPGYDHQCCWAQNWRLLLAE